MRGIVTAAFCVAVVGASFAQQDAKFTQYMFDRLSINPAVAGTTGELCGTLMLRQQWTGFDGAPRTALLNVHGQLKRISSGIGLSVFLDKLGQQNSTIARLHYFLPSETRARHLGYRPLRGHDESHLGQRLASN